MKTHKILVPINLCYNSNYSLDQAILLKKKYSLIHIVLITQEYPRVNYQSEELEKKRMNIDLLVFAKKYFNNKIPEYISIKLETGSTGNIISKLHKKEKYQLIIVNKSIVNNIGKKIFTCDIIKNIITQTNCNVYSINKKSDNNYNRKILIPIEACKNQYNVISEALDIARANNISIILMAILNTKIDLKHSISYQKTCKISNYYKENGIACETIIYIQTTNSLQEALEKTIEETRANIIVLSSEYSWINTEAQLSSLGQYIIKDTKLDILNVRLSHNCFVTNMLDTFKKCNIEKTIY